MATFLIWPWGIDMIKFRCAGCGQKLGVPDAYGGKRVKCSGCGEPVAVPAAVAASGEALGPGDEVAALEPAGAPALVARAAAQPGGSERVCPKCGAACGASAALCTRCGHSFKFGVNVQTVARARTAASFTGRTTFAIVGGAIAAGLGAALWAGVVIGTGYEIGWVAWGVGLLVGLVVAGVARSTSPGVGLAAAGLALAGLLLGKLLIFQWGAPAIATQEIEASAAMMRQAVAVQMVEAGEATEELIAAVGGMSFGGEVDDGAFAPVDAKLAAMSGDERHRAAEHLAAAVLDAIPMGERVQMQLSPFDLLWGFLAVGTAFKIGAGGAGGD